MSNRDEWATPHAILDGLFPEFEFDLDVCANANNTKAAVYFTEEDDGLTQPWGGVCWMNPPYSNIAPWVEKAWRESLNGSTIVALLPAATDTNWFWDWVKGKAEIRFIKGRVQFEPPPGVKASSNPHASILAIYRPFGATL
jgi:phage N-6-adenine-methyltransferase